MEGKVEALRLLGSHLTDVFKVFLGASTALVFFLFVSNQFDNYVVSQGKKAFEKQRTELEALPFEAFVKYFDIYPATCPADPDELDYNCVAPVDTPAHFWSDFERSEAVTEYGIAKLTWEEVIKWDLNPADSYRSYSQWVPVNTTSRILTEPKARDLPIHGERRTGFAANYPNNGQGKLEPIIYEEVADYVLESHMCLYFKKFNVEKCITKVSRHISIR